MKKFKLLWDERICDEDGDTLYFEKNQQIIEAEDEDAACDIWNKENEHNDCQNGLDDCFEIVESPLFQKHIFINMPDGLTYAVPVELVARNRAEYYAHKEYGGDIAKSLTEDTLPLFIDDNREILDWAINNMNWSEVEQDAIVVERKTSKDESQEHWVNGEHEIK